MWAIAKPANASAGWHQVTSLTFSDQRQYLQALWGLNVVIGDDDPWGSSVFRTTGFDSSRTTEASKSAVPFIFSVQATDNAARPSRACK
jgi:hypothetical protein